jgi:SAM-dependent methyltransferase
MVALLRARARAESLSIDAQVMDGQALDFADGAFDVCASQHGVSLFADMHAGLGEMARVTCQGGRVLVVAFGSFANAEFITFVLRAVNAVAPQSAPPPLDSPPPPFQVADSVALQRAIEDAGLVDVRVESTTWKFEFRSGAQLWRLTTSSNPIARQLIGPLSEAEQSEAVRVLDGMLRERAAGALSATLHTAINIGIGTRSPR